MTPATAQGELLEFIQAGPDGARRLNLAVPDAYCATCIQAIEGALNALPGVRLARVNLGKRRVQIDFDREADFVAFPDAVVRSGYRNHPIDPQDLDDRDPVLRELVYSLVVSGFATLHVMFFSEAIWTGVEGEARTLFYWISALVAVPAVAYAGRPFFRPAWSALRVWRANMDVPIAIALIATTAISLLETRLGGEHAYFDASTMLLFFLLIGRTLDHVMRGQARHAASNLARLAPRGAQRLLDDGTLAFVRLDEIEPGMCLLLRSGDRAPVDCQVLSQAGAVDLSLVNGESMPHETLPGEQLPAGAMVLDRPLKVLAAKPAADSYLSRTAALMEAVETTRTRYRRIADRAADLYAPMIHLAALLTFLIWLFLGAGWRLSLINAVAVLIVTCPCALALAVPIVHVVAAGRLFFRGVLMKDGAALERLATVRTVAFDKTGTLTTGRPILVGQSFGNPDLLQVAAVIGAASTHPLSKALAASAAGELHADCHEVPGSGVEARIGTSFWRLGSAGFCGAEDDGAGEGSRVWLAQDGAPVAAFDFADDLRPDAPQTIARLKSQQVGLVLLSGDRRGSVQRVAARLGNIAARFALSPQAKSDAIAELREQGAVAMVGDGINDAIALRAADVSFAPAAAADVGRAAADFVLTNDRLAGIPFALWLARRADALVRQNLALSVLYNVVMLPLAALGYMTPLLAAIAMSSSSLIVVLNALRLRLAPGPQLSRLAK
ncbi:MAG: heavy metal translocating P-type ATPase [Candidatus Devosia phytovorans]|uniref:Heavy metal translocating P-type ATPase n=1 Tax=Candidatus Devosia phytovorans TaxID=3121372 RepID=A0AAJ5W043_9HYPH|nr:heavy metal translocating P-type ATPase [Devosia sp.]WEK06664.1 MAG: heavy metal translocating P-type ATPase [Devosia sp.]